jgi:hypothetical protein
MPHKALLLAVAPFALAALRDPGCGSNTVAGGPNAPCTRSMDCEDELACLQGVCVPRDAASPVITPQHPTDSAADGTIVDD